MDEKTQGNNDEGLTRYLSPAHVWALAFGCSVGWGAFVMPGTTFLPIAGPLGTAVGMLLGAAVMMVIGMNYHYMMNRFPDAGGAFTYTKKIFGYDHGFLCAWFLGLTYIAIIWANATALALIPRRLFGDMFQWGFHYRLADYDIYGGEVALTIFALALFGLICMRGKCFAVWLQTAMATVLLLGILACFAAVWDFHGWSFQEAAPAFAPEGNPFAEVFNIVALVPWAFIGFESVSHSTGEFRFSAKKSFSLMALAVATGCAAYTLITEMAVLAVPEGYGSWPPYISDLGHLDGLQGLPSFLAVYEAMGDPGLVLLCITVLASIITGLVGNYIAASRLLYAMASDGILPQWLSRLGRGHVPGHAVLFILVISLAIPFFGRTAIGWIVDVTTIGATIAYGYTSATAYKAARADGNAMVQATGMIGIVVSAVVSLFFLVPNLWAVSALATDSYLILAFWSILGFVFFRFIFQKDEERRLGKSTVVWIALLFLIFFTSLMWMRQATHSATEEVVGNIRSFYTEELEDRRLRNRADRQERETAFLDEQMDAVHSSLLQNSLVQLLLTVFSLFIMFNIYSTMRGREKQLEGEKVQAEENSRAKTMFLSNMSHDIRTPMNAIIGYINLAKRKGTTAEDVQGFLGKIEASSQHLLALINDVLEMSRIESGKMELEEEDTDLCATLGELRDMFATQMEAKGVRFIVDTKAVRNRRVICDKNHLNRVLLNLVSNAYKFTPEGGSVTVTLSQGDDAPDGRGSYELRVKDSGIGMTEEFAQKVFEAFERERTSTVSGIQGTGLGMAITKSIIDMMQGTIDVITAPGQGTEFVIHLRFAMQEDIPEEDGQAAEAQEQAMDFHGKKLLLVEDIEVNREIAVMILSEAGFVVDTAVNGKEAVDKVAAASPGDYDAILMDIQMPVMNGYEATKAIRAMADPGISRIPIIAMTANAFSEDIQAAKAAGMDAHIAKPIDVGAMMKTLAHILR